MQPDSIEFQLLSEYVENTARRKQDKILRSC